jgi:excisionase family DNA binding protein
MSEQENQSRIQPQVCGSARQSPWTDKDGIAEYYGWSVRHVTNLMKRRKIPYIKTGRCVRFHVPECDKAMEAFKIRSVGQSYSLAGTSS